MGSWCKEGEYNAQRSLKLELCGRSYYKGGGGAVSKLDSLRSLDSKLISLPHIFRRNLFPQHLALNDHYFWRKVSPAILVYHTTTKFYLSAELSPQGILREKSCFVDADFSITHFQSCATKPRFQNHNFMVYGAVMPRLRRGGPSECWWSATPNICGGVLQEFGCARATGSALC